MPHLPGEPSSVEADPGMLPNYTGEHEKKKGREKTKLEESKRGEQSQESLGERLFPLHAWQVAPLHMNGHGKNIRLSLFTFGRGSCCRWPLPSPASSPSRPSAWHHQPPAGPAQPQRSPDGQHWRCQTHHQRRQCPHHLERTKDKRWGPDYSSNLLSARRTHRCRSYREDVLVPVPRFCRRSLVRISSNLACVLSLGSLTWTPPRSPVPRLEGQVRM